MYYRVVIIANFPQEPTQARLNRVIKYLEDNAMNINTGKLNPEPTRARLELCHHDETPSAPCDLVRAWELPEQP